MAREPINILIFAEVTNLVTAFCAPAGYYPGSGTRHQTTGTTNAVGTTGEWWASGVSGIYGCHIWAAGTGVDPSHNDAGRAYGLIVRCLQAFISHFLGRKEQEFQR